MVFDYGGNLRTRAKLHGEVGVHVQGKGDGGVELTGEIQIKEKRKQISYSLGKMFAHKGRI